MKQRENVNVHPEFKRLLKLEAATNGKSVIEFTKELVDKKPPAQQHIDQLIDNWKGKYKKVEHKGFDFP